MKKSAVSCLLVYWICTIQGNSEVQFESESKMSDIASVSKFISDFHRQFEGDSLEMARSKPLTVDCPSKKTNALLSNPPSPVTNVTNDVGSSESNSTFVKCKTESKLGSLTVELVNSTRLVSLLLPDQNVTSRMTPAECLILLFYSRSCPFSCLAAPHFNALPRAFPSIKVVAINAMQFQSFNSQYGIAGVPTVMLFHNGRPAAKFNDSEYTLEMFARFITRTTGTKPVEKMFVTSGDFGGPVPSVLAKEPDYMLGLAWTVIIIAIAVGISKSTGWRTLVETMQNTWREAQAAEHEHNY